MEASFKGSEAIFVPLFKVVMIFAIDFIAFTHEASRASILGAFFLMVHRGFFIMYCSS